MTDETTMDLTSLVKPVAAGLSGINTCGSTTFILLLFAALGFGFGFYMLKMFFDFVKDGITAVNALKEKLDDTEKNH